MWLIIEKLIVVLPKIISWWLYQEKRTLKNVIINVSAQEGSCEIYCSELSTFTICFEILNNNPFWIDIDRIVIKGNYATGTAKLFAENMIGAKIGSNSSERFNVTGDIDSSQIERIKAAPDDKSHVSCEIQIVMNNKYNKIRYRERLERLMCKVINKNV